MRSKQMALLASISIHCVLGWLLITQTYKVASSKQQASLKTYIIPVAQQREIFAKMAKPKSVQKPTPKSKEAIEEITKKPVPKKINKSEQVEINASQNLNQKPINGEPQQASNNLSENSTKIIKFNRFKSLESVIEKEQQAYFKSQQFNNQISQPKVKIKPTQKYQDLVNEQAEVVAGRVTSSRKTLKYKGKCYLVDSSSEMGNMDMPSSSGFPCPGEKSDNEILLKSSLDKYLKKKQKRFE